MANPTEQEPVKYKLLVEFVYQRERKFLNKVQYLIQNKPVKCGLRIRNIDDKDSPQGKIKHLKLKSGEGGTINQTLDEEFALPALNPGQEITLWWPNQLTVVIKGQSWVSCTFEPQDSKKHSFATYQYDRFSKKEFPYKGVNSWGDAILIRGELEQQQAKTNLLMFVLTLLVFLDGVWGLNIIIKNIFSFLGWLFFKASQFLIKLS